MMATTAGALIESLKKYYDTNETVIAIILTQPDYENACEGTPIPWERGAHILTEESDWIYPEIHNWMAQTIGEEEEK
jgi:hypothetical protein